MAAPQVSEVIQKHPSKVLVYFDQPLDEDVQFPSTCFSINYGKIPISGADYYGTSAILLMIDRELSFRDKIEVNYQPPEDITLAIRSPLAPGASTVVHSRNAVRAFFKVAVRNLLPVDENAWMANSNLGGGKSFVPDPDDPTIGDVPSVDICGDGSVIIGAPGIIDGNESNANGGGNPDGGTAPMSALDGVIDGSVVQHAYPSACWQVVSEIQPTRT